jgi:hypothetical protein
VYALGVFLRPDGSGYPRTVLKGWKGVRYPDMTREPKDVFDAIAARFGAAASRR